MELWYKVAIPQAEVREGRSFNPDDFAIAFEHVVAQVAPEDYPYPQHFFDRTCFTRALKEHVDLVLLRRSERGAEGQSGRARCQCRPGRWP